MTNRDRCNRTFRGIIAVLAGIWLAAGPFGLDPAGAEGVGDSRVRVVQHNPDMWGPGDALAAAYEWGDVDAMTFQELCSAQVEQLRASGFDVFWMPQRDMAGVQLRAGVPGCPKDSQGQMIKGNAIATPAGAGRTIGATSEVPLGKSNEDSPTPSRTFRLLCAQINGTGLSDLTECTTTHLSLDYDNDNQSEGAAIRARQTGLIADALNHWVDQGSKIILTGDFNDEPDAAQFDSLYRVQPDGTVGGAGRFWEGDQGACGAAGRLCRSMKPTTDSRRALDYAFVGHTGVDPRHGVSKGLIDSPGSGHHVVRLEVSYG